MPKRVRSHSFPGNHYGGHQGLRRKHNPRHQGWRHMLPVVGALAARAYQHWREPRNDVQAIQDGVTAPGVSGTAPGHVKKVFMPKHKSKRGAMKKVKKQRKFKTKILRALYPECPANFAFYNSILGTGNQADKQMWLEIPILVGAAYATPYVQANAAAANFSSVVDKGDWAEVCDSFMNTTNSNIVRYFPQTANAFPVLGTQTTITTPKSTNMGGFIYGYIMNVTIINPCTVPVKVYVQHIRCKKDIAYASAGNTDNVLSSLQNFIGNNNTILGGVANSGLVGKGFLYNTANSASYDVQNKANTSSIGVAEFVPNNIGFHVLNDKSFGSFWDLLSETEYILDASQTMNFEIKVKCPKYVKVQDFMNKSFVKGVSQLLLCRYHTITIDSANANQFCQAASANVGGAFTHGLGITYIKKFYVRPNSEPGPGPVNLMAAE